MRNPVLRPVNLDEYIEAKVSGGGGGGEREREEKSFENVYPKRGVAFFIRVVLHLEF